MVGHSYPLYSGCGTIAQLLARLTRASGEHCARLPGGVRCFVSLDDFDGRALYFAGATDRKILWACRKILRPGDNVIDVGANLGMVALTCANLVRTGQVAAYEPNPSVMDYLQRSVNRNGMQNVSLHGAALGARTGSMTLHIPLAHSGRATLLSPDRECADVVVPVLNTSDAIQSLGMHYIRLMKIDVEGFEAEVIEGAASFLEATPPDAILFESHAKDHGAGPMATHPVVSALLEHGYSFCYLPRALFRMRALPLDLTAEHPATHDVIAVRNRDLYRRLTQ